MIEGMTKAKIAVTIDEDLVTMARRAVESGRARSLSAYIEEALAAWVAHDDFDALLDLMLEETGGPLTEEEIAWADQALNG
jgi:Arc/MetJ-type ribon-helix-helix transcriptional regulator